MKRILYVLHSGMAGGTFQTTFDLIKNLNNEYEVFILGAEHDSLRLYEYSKNKLNLIKKYPRNFNLNTFVNDTKVLINKWSAKEFHNSWLTYIYFEILVNYNIDVLHIMHLIYHSFDLPQVADKLDIPVILSIHDFYFLCPFYTLLDENNHYCNAKCSKNRENCYIPWPILSDIKSKEFIDEWRKNVLNMFKYIQYFTAPSEIIKDLFLSVYTNKSIINEDTFKIIEHGRDFPRIHKKYYEEPLQGKPIKILCLANNLDLMKGSEVIKNIKKEDMNNLIEFHFLGNVPDDLKKYGINHGPYKIKELYKKIYEIKPSFIGVFSIWPESFCHTITEAWSCSVPVIGSNIGVVEDRIRRNNGGWIININDAHESYNQIINISKNINEYNEIINHLKSMKFKTTSEMAKEYLEIYNMVE